MSKKKQSSSYNPKARGTIDATAAARLPYRLGVGVLLLNREDQVFVAQRLDMRAEAWQMPQGGIDKGEAPRDAAFRELKEEIGTNDAEILAETDNWLDYDLPLDLVPKIWKGRYRGQRQKWFAMRFLGHDRDIDIAGPHAEFSQWRWSPIAELPDLIVPFKADLYRKIVSEFTPLVGQRTK